MAEGVGDRDWRSHRRPLDRLTTGAYAAARELNPEDLHRLRVRAVVDRLAHVAVTHTSAATCWGLPVTREMLGSVHLSPTEERKGRPKSAPGYHLHSRPLPSEHRRLLGGLPMSDPLLTVLDSARVVSPDWGVVIADAALHLGLIQAEELGEAAARVQHSTGAARARRLPGLASALAESPGETLTRLRLRRLGFQPREQVVIGRYRGDFLVEDWLLVEFDGRAKYSMDGSPEAAHWNEKRRHDYLVELGYEIVHVTWDQLWDEQQLADRIFRGLARVRQRHQ